MRKNIKRVLFIVFVLLLVGLGFQFYNTYQKKNAQLSLIEKIPKFELRDCQGNLYNDGKIIKDTWVVLVFFNTQCHFCQDEAQQLVEFKGEIGNTQFIWISSERMEDVKDFKVEYGLEAISNVVLLQDEQGELASSLGVGNVPEFLVYNMEGELVKKHKGAWRIDALLEDIKNGFKVN